MVNKITTTPKPSGIIAKINEIIDALASYVPTTRKVNNKALSADISLTASDVGAATSNHAHSEYSNKDTMRSTEFIVGTQTASTGSWTGVTQDTTLYDGKNINYFLPYAGSGNASLNLTLAGGTTTGAKPVYLWGTSYVTTHYPVNSCINMTYNATKGAWFVNADRDANNYERLQNSNNLHTRGAITANTIIVAKENGYKTAASGVTFNISYPILYSTSAIDNDKNFTSGYYAYPSIALTNTKSGWTGTQWSVVYMVGTLTGTIFTIDSAILTTTVPTTADGKVYTPIGVCYDTTHCYFRPSNDYYAYINGKFQRLTYVHPTTSGNKHIPSGGSSNQILKYSSDGTAAWSALKTINSNSLVGSGDIPVQPTLVSGTNIKTINGVSILGSGNIDVSAASQSTNFDGQWVNAYTAVFTAKSITAGTHVIADLSSILPNDNYSYECLFRIRSDRDDSSGTNNYLVLTKTTDGVPTGMSDGKIWCCVETDGANFQQAQTVGIVPIGSEREIRYTSLTYACNASLWLIAYRRIGTNL